MTAGPGSGGPVPTAGWDLGHLRAGLAVVGLLAAVGAPLTWWLRGGRGALWVLAGLAIVAAFFTVGTLAVVAAGRINDEYTLGAALASYLVKVVLLGVLLVTARDQSWVDGPALAWSVLAGTLAWVGTHIHRVFTSPIYYVDPRPPTRPEHI
jgi:hypothetical protein